VTQEFVMQEVPLLNTGKKMLSTWLEHQNQCHVPEVRPTCCVCVYVRTTVIWAQTT